GVVLCGSAVNILNYHGPGRCSPLSFPRIHPDRNWREARQEFFRWPQQELVHFVYGVFRRQALQGVSLGARKYRGRRIAMDMEYPILTALATRGRIVALPDVLRTYRFSPESTGFREYGTYTGLDKFLLALQMKTYLLHTAWNLSLPVMEKAELLALTFRN